jgi:hypothetical protein
VRQSSARFAVTRQNELFRTSARSRDWVSDDWQAQRTHEFREGCPPRPETAQVDLFTPAYAPRSRPLGRPGEGWRCRRSAKRTKDPVSVTRSLTLIRGNNGRPLRTVLDSSRVRRHRRRSDDVVHPLRGSIDPRVGPGLPVVGALFLCLAGLFFRVQGVARPVPAPARSRMRREAFR